MEQNSLNRMVRDSHHSHYSQAASGKRHKPNRHGSGTTTSKRRTGRSVDQPQEARSGRRSDKSVDQPETRGDKKESDSKQYSEEDRVNFGVMDVLGLVNRTVEEVRVSGGAVAEEEDQNIIPLIVWSQDNQDDPASTNTSTLKNITSVPLMAPVISSAESPSPASPVPTHAVEEQPAVEERPIPLVPILASQTNEAVITQIQHVVHQIQQEKEQQLSKEEEKRIDEEDNEETGIILTTAIQDQTETAVTELFTQTSGAADWNDLLVVGSDIPVTEADTPLPKSTPNTGPISESPRPEYPQSPVLQDSVEVTSGYISVQENAESDVTTSHPKFTMETVPPQPPNTSQTLPDDGIFSIHAATLNTRTATPDSTPNVTTPSIPLTTTSSNQTFYTQTIPLDATTTPLTTETLPAEDTTTHVPVTLPYVSLPNTQTTTKDASISPPQTTPADTRIASSDVPTTSPVTSSDLLAPSVLTSTELWALKETHSPVNLTTLEGSTEDVDEMLEKLKDQFLTEYLLNGNQPSEDPSDLYLGTLGGTKSEEDTSWVTAGMVVSGAATLPSSSQAQDLMGVSGHPIETTVMPKATTLEEEAMNILGTENFNDFSIMHDTTTDASLAAETEPVTVEDSDESTESGPTANLVSVTEPVTGFAFTTPDYFTDTSTASATTAATTTAIITTTTTTTPLAGSGDGSQDVHLTVKIEEPPEDTHSDPDFPLQDDGNKQATINLVINTVASSSSATTIHLAPSTATTAAPAIPTLPITTSTLTTTSTLITIIPTTIHNIISAFPPTTTTTTTISSSLLTTSTHTPVTTATIGFDVTSVTTTAPTTTVTTLHAALPFTTISVTPTTTTTITLGLSTAHLPGTGDSMQVELTVTDPESVQVVGDLVMADHGAPQSPAEIHQVTPPPALADDIPWLVLDGSEASVSLPPEIVVSSDIGFPGDIYEPSVVSHETAVTVAQHNAAPATSEEVTTESLGGAVQGLTEEEGSDALGEEPLSEFQIVNNESNGLTDEENSVTTSTEQDNFAASDIVEPSSSGDVTVTEAVLQGTTTSQNLMGATSSPTADVAPGGTITMPPGEASPGSLTTPAGGQEPSPTTTTTTYAPSITTTTSSSSATTHKPSTTITTTLPAMTVTKATLGAQINIHVHDAHSDVEDTDSSENTIEATIDLIANSDDYTLPQDLHAEEEEEEEEEEEDFYEAFSEIEEESEPVSEEPVCGGAYVMVRQRLVCGAQLRHSLQDHISSPDGECTHRLFTHQ
ncbi:hypothetical protein E2C01_000511 [Portunus trituberculatus]|uniref:Uncharacterized protein n=1 Tax=Portunus trituberculatus TaxID=210409 RepID=A0A5B7CFB8_PORTR|nr:hypothetical protein [Portunus trituberculatus]